jgi:hypothetical protein
MVSAMLTKLGMTRRTQVAVLIAGMPDHVDDPGYGSYRLSLFPDRVAEVTAALLECISETRTIPITDGERAQDALRLADALAATSTGPGSRRPRLSPA